jgi:hypothetical protein
MAKEETHQKRDAAHKFEDWPVLNWSTEAEQVKRSKTNHAKKTQPNPNPNLSPHHTISIPLFTTPSTPPTYLHTITPLTKFTAVKLTSSPPALIVATLCCAFWSLKIVPVPLISQSTLTTSSFTKVHSQVPEVELATTPALLALTLAPRLPKLALMEIFCPLAGMLACTAVSVLSWESWTRTVLVW